MKAKSIGIIREMLMEEQKKSEEAYKQFRENMACKYKTDWFNSEMNETEKKLLEKLRVRWSNLNETLDEFEQYQW